ncbi:MAG TPA: lipopolysaccharide heptosyltransferase II [Caulobacteraceae bacterium]|nr:lipopolysaccharide heptosyltransferase II [Caulobacteraceae bacterium]
MRILIVAPSWLGDAVMMGSLLARLKARAPAPRIAVLAPLALEDVVRRMPGVDEVIENPFAHGALRLGGRWRLGRALAGRFEAAIVLPQSFKSALVPWFAGVPRRTGFIGEARHLLLNDARPLDEARLPRLVDRFCLLAEPPGAAAPADAPAPRLGVSAGAADAARTRFGLVTGRPAVAFCVGAEYGPAKRWPAVHFAALATIAAAHGMDVWLLGSKRDAGIGAEVAVAASGAVVDLVGRTSLGDAIELLSGAAAVVSNDSGLMHVAAALGRPLVALYGSSSPAFTPPLSPAAAILTEALACSPCFERRCPLGHLKCLNDLAPQRVWQALQAQLGQTVALA